MVSLDISSYPKVAIPLAVVGSALVFLLAIAALSNAVFAGAPLPGALRDGAVIAHLATVLVALPLGISQLVLPKGTARHRTVGYIWCPLMVVTALSVSRCIESIRVVSARSTSFRCSPW